MFEVWLGDVGLILSLSLKFMLIEFEDDPHMSYVECRNTSIQKQKPWAENIFKVMKHHYECR